MSQLGQSRRFDRLPVTSDLPPQADNSSASRQSQSATVVYGAVVRFQVVRSVMPFGVWRLSNLSSVEVSRIIVLFRLEMAATFA
jgi:hypothetical protein